MNQEPQPPRALPSTRDVVVEAWPPEPPPGAMRVGMPMGVRAIHLPTGLSVIADSERSQHLNRDRALAELAEQLDAMKDSSTRSS